MSEKREESRRQNDELWDKKFTDNEDVDSTGHLSRTERRKQEAHSSTITTVLVVLIIVLAASPLIFWLNNKQSFNSAAREAMTTRQSTAGQAASSNREPAANRQYVVVRRGQSVYRIAAQNGLTAQELARLNNISINTPIHPGQQLRVR